MSSKAKNRSEMVAMHRVSVAQAQVSETEALLNKLASESKSVTKDIGRKRDPELEEYDDEPQDDEPVDPDYLALQVRTHKRLIKAAMRDSHKSLGGAMRVTE